MTNIDPHPPRRCASQLARRLTTEVTEPMTAWKARYFPRPSPQAAAGPAPAMDDAITANRERIIFQRRALSHAAAVLDISSNPAYIRVGG